MKLSNPAEYVKKLTTVLEVTKAYRGIIHLDVLLSTIVETAADTVGAEASSILLFDDEGKLRFHSASGRAARVVKPMSVEPGQGIAGWTAMNGEPAIVNDAATDPRFARGFDRESGFVTRSILCVPLTFEGRVIGVLELLNKKDDGKFDEEDQTLLFSLADQAAISIEHVRLQDAQNNYFTHLPEAVGRRLIVERNVSETLIGVMDTHVPIKDGHARRVARYARLVATGLGLSNDEQHELYFAGLLHDIGKLVLWRQMQDEYIEVYDAAKENGGSLHEFELDRLGFDHADAAFAIAESWALPESLADALFTHHPRADRHLDESKDPQLSALIRIANLASREDFEDEAATHETMASCNDEEAWGILVPGADKLSPEDRFSLLKVFAHEVQHMPDLAL